MIVRGMSVQARRVADAYPGLHSVHLRALRPRPTLAALERLGLTRRQAQVLQMMLLGRSASQIALALSLSVRTIEKHMQATYARLGAANRTEAIVIAARAL
jgi:DNA-binding NarL/FixJ family response regulator